MEKLMPVDVLSSIKGAKPSDAVSKLFEKIKTAYEKHEGNMTTLQQKAVQVNALREDEVLHSSERERAQIIANFPKEKDGFLLVSKVIEG